MSDSTWCLTGPAATPSMAIMDLLHSTAFERRATVSPLAADEIHVWFVAVDAGVSPRAIGEAARAALERLLCAYANCAQPPAIERGVHGKPFAPELPGLDFNLSHAGPHVLLAFARAQAIGIDLERCDRRLSLDGIAHRFFAASEAQALTRLPPVAQRETFLRLWTHKEAVLKALGTGINFGLDRVEFMLDRDNGVSALLNIAAEAGSVSEWNLHRIDPAPGLMGALAWRGATRSVRAFTLAP